MKSKKIIAIALTAAMAISAVSTTAFAADVSVKEKAEMHERIATVKFESSDVGKAYSETKELPKLDNTSLYKFIGWIYAANANAETLKAAYEKTSDEEAVAAVSGGTLVKDNVVDYSDIKNGTYDGTLSEEETKITEDDVKNSSLTLCPVYRRWASEEEAKKAAEDAKNADDKAAAEKTRAEHLDAEDANHAATGNTKDENGARKTSPAIVTPDDKGGKDSETDPYTDKERAHLLNVAKASDENQVVYLFDVNAPEGLLEGMNARVTLPIPGGTDGYKVTVYHVVDAYKRQKVSGLDIGANDVTFWANDFSPYVAVLAPKDAVTSAGTDNPGTGDFSAVPVALLAAAALGATGFVGYKKKKAE